MIIGIILIAVISTVLGYMIGDYYATNHTHLDDPSGNHIIEPKDKEQ